MNATNTQASGPRLPLVTEPTDPEAIAQFASIRARTGRILNLHRMMGHSPAMMKASADTAMALRHGTQLPRSLIEVVILRTAQLMRSDYEWQQHHPMALANGVSQEKIDAVADWRDSKLFPPAETAALAYAECVALGTEAEPAIFARLQEHFSPREIVELTMLVAQYMATARFIQALGVPLEDTGARPKPSS